MNLEDTLALMSICAVVGTAFNMFLSLRIANSIGAVKEWTREHFVAKDDLRRYIRTKGI